MLVQVKIDRPMRWSRQKSKRSSLSLFFTKNGGLTTVTKDPGIRQIELLRFDLINAAVYSEYKASQISMPEVLHTLARFGNQLYRAVTLRPEAGSIQELVRAVTLTVRCSW